METEKTINEYEQARIDKLVKLRELGVDPYGHRFDDTEDMAAIAAKYDPENEQQVVRGAGRIVLLRDIGKLIFINYSKLNTLYTNPQLSIFIMNDGGYVQFFESSIF